MRSKVRRRRSDVNNIEIRDRFATCELMPKQKVSVPMETSFHVRSVDAVSNVHMGKPINLPTRSEIRAAAEDDVALENMKALKSALMNTPASRQEAVNRATELIGDAKYPPMETIRMISHLLAIKLHPDGEQN
jgi:hypothetical protein